MFEVLMKNLIEERTKLFDRCTRELINKAGFELSKNASEMEMAMLIEDFHLNGYRLKYHYEPVLNKDYIQLIHKEDGFEKIEMEFIVEVETSENSVNIVAREFK